MALELIAKREDRLAKHVKDLDKNLTKIANNTDVKDGFGDVVDKLEEILQAIKKSGGGGHPGGGKGEHQCTDLARKIISELQEERGKLHELFELAKIAIFDGVEGPNSVSAKEQAARLYYSLKNAGQGEVPLTQDQLEELVICARLTHPTLKQTKSA
jgi:hypothetical protein